MLAFAVWLLWRSRRERAGVRPVQLAVVAVVGLYLVQAVLGIVVVAVGENSAVEIIHSSFASLTWAALATLLALTWTLPAGDRRIAHASCGAQGAHAGEGTDPSAAAATPVSA
jgi:heme A synthase